MNSLFRSLAKDTVVYGVGDVISRGISFLALPLLTRALSKLEFGLWSYLLTAAGFFAAIAAVGGDSVYARFFFAEKTLKGRQLLTSTWFAFLAAFSACLTFACFAFTSEFSYWSFDTTDYTWLTRLALIAVPVTLMNQMMSQALRNEFRTVLFVTLNTVTAVLTVSLALGAVFYLDMGVEGLLLSALIVGVALLPIRVWTVRHLLRPVFSFSLLRVLLRFGLPLVPSTLAYWIFTMSDRLVIGQLSDLDELGLYSAATKAVGILAILCSVLGQAWSPRAIRVYEERPDVSREFYGRVMTYILVCFGFLGVSMTTFSHEVTAIIAPSTYADAAKAFGPLTLAATAFATTQVTAASISLTRRTYWLAVLSWLAAAVNLASNIAFVPEYGMVAASWTTAASNTLLTLGYLFVSQKLWAVAYQKARVGMAVALIVSFTLISPVLPAGINLYAFSCRTVYLLIFLVSILTFCKIDPRSWRDWLRRTDDQE